MGDKYRKTSPQRQPEKQRLKLCGQGSGPTLAIKPRQDSYTAAVHPDMGTTRLPGFPEDTPPESLPSTAPVADTPGFWESFCQELGVGAGTHRAGTSRGH